MSCDGLKGTNLSDVAAGRQLELARPADTSRRAAFSPDGRRLLLVDREVSQLRTWNSASGRITPPTIVTGATNVARFSPDGRVILTGGFDGSAVLRSATTGRAVASLPRADAELVGATFSPDRRLVLSADDNGTAQAC